MRTRRHGRNTHPVAAGAVGGNVPVNGDTTKPYRYGSTGTMRPAPDATYTVDGPDGVTEHRWDGLCHDDCENLR